MFSSVWSALGISVDCYIWSLKQKALKVICKMRKEKFPFSTLLRRSWKQALPCMSCVKLQKWLRYWWLPQSIVSIKEKTRIWTVSNLRDDLLVCLLYIGFVTRLCLMHPLHRLVLHFPRKNAVVLDWESSKASEIHVANSKTFPILIL